MSRLVVRLSFALALWLLASLAFAQSTGSSYGGGSWGGSSGGSSSSGGGYHSGGGYSGVSYDDPNAYEPSWGVQCLIFWAFIVLLVVVFRYGPRLLDRLASEKIDVARVQLALDARARRFVQERLKTLGQQGDTATAAGRAALLAASARALRDTRVAWIYAGTTRLARMPIQQAQGEFKRLSDDARAGFQHELSRAKDGRTTEGAAPAMTPKEHEGEGAVLVTLIAASRPTLRDARASSPDEIDALLVQLAGLSAGDLVAMEVVWTPATDEDRMSTDELEQRYPTLTKLPGATGGRVFCASCRGPYAAELTHCPHCGAPRAGA